MIDRIELKRMAEAAEGAKFQTEGFEQTTGGGQFYGGLILHENGHTIIASCVMQPWADFIAAANPAVVLELISEIERLEALRPHWAQGFTSDGVAAQVQTTALNQIWKILGVTNQTECMAEIERLKGGQGEPVYQTCNGVEGWIDVDLLRYSACSLEPEGYETRILYTSQPAPVSMVLPERRDLSKKMFDEMSPSERDISFKDIGWNACLDKAKELNQ